jgi:monofunctional biosynthetic peptidoglycan transglycosylase
VKRRQIIALAAALAAAGICVLAVMASMGRGAEEVARRIEIRLSEALSAQCRVGSVKILSTREVRLRAVGCIFDDGPVLGLGIGEAEVMFQNAPLGDQLPLVERFSANDVEIRVSEQEALSILLGRSFGSDDPTAEESSPSPEVEGQDDEDLSLGVERETLRFLEFSRVLELGRGGENVTRIMERLTPGAIVRIDRTAIQDEEGRNLLSDLHARLENSKEGLSIALAAQLGPGGGLAAFDGTLTAAGLRDANIRIERIPVAKALGRVTGTALEVADGVASGSLAYRPAEGESVWTIDIELLELLVHKDSIGRDWLPLPPIRLQGRLVPIPEERSLSLDQAVWSVAETGGALEAFLGPLGLDEQPRFDVRLAAPRLRLGRLLAALPDSLMPASWAEELQGTMAIEATFDGLLHEREKWDLDWNSDFSQMLLASGSLAQQVERLKEPFEHVFPIQADGRVITRTMGPEDPTFVAFDEISRHLINAVVSTEDSGFFRHAGFEEDSIKEAMLENLRDGEGRGGSTITQQLAKNLFLSGERTFARKLKEAIIAWRLESELPKERILEIYLNIAEWGPGFFGAREAARHYYDRRVSRLRPEQAAFLASLLPSPVRYHGYYHADGLSKKRFRVIQRILHTMHSHGRLNADEFQLSRGAPIDMTWCALPAKDDGE